MKDFGKRIVRLLRYLNRVPKIVWGTLALFFFVLTLIGFEFQNIENIHIGAFGDLYETVIGFWPNATKVLPNFKFACIGATAIFLVLFLYRRRYYLISLRSFSHDLGEVEIGDHKKGCMILDRKIDVTKEFSQNKIKNAVKIMDHEIESFNRIRGDSLVGFYGIAHTPLLFRAGYLIGDQSNVFLFHKGRANDSKFTEWSNDAGGFRINNPKELNDNIHSDELIVSISTTFEIKYEEMMDLHPQDKHIIMFTANNLGFDVIRNNVDADAAKRIIYTTTRDIVKRYGIQKIHLIIASSAAFTFLLGMGYSKQHDPACIVYHYQQSHYPWGISVKTGHVVRTTN